jgi:antitoxin PrlF
LITSKLTSKAQTTIPLTVRTALHLYAGDELAYAIEDGRVILTRADRGPIDDPFATFDEGAPKPIERPMPTFEARRPKRSGAAGGEIDARVDQHISEVADQL